MRFLGTFLVMSALSAVPTAAIALSLFACEPEWAALAQEIGGDRIDAFAATTARQDPHRIEARPSLIARMRRADLVVCTGAELEAGWLPMLLRQAGNGRVQPGQPGYFEAAQQIERLGVPAVVDRALGDIHPSGNPHVHLDPHRLLVIAEALSTRLQTLDGANADDYRRRHEAFAVRWQKAIARWEARAAPLRGQRVVTHHQDFAYLFAWLGMEEAGTLEPKPGLPSSAGHLAGLKKSLLANPARVVVHAAYQDARPAQWLSAQLGLPVVELPYTVGGTTGANDLFGLFDETIRRLWGEAP